MSDENLTAAEKAWRASGGHDRDKARREAYKAFTSYTPGPPLDVSVRPLGVPSKGPSIVDRMNQLFDERIANTPIEHRAAVRQEVERERAEWMANANAVAQKHENIRAAAIAGKPTGSA
jgi:hypothetical protein